MPKSNTRSSVLHHFAAVPHRAFCDKRLKSRHYRVLGAICIAVDSKTGHALISQMRISDRAAISRQHVTDVVRDLERWGHIRRIVRGRNRRGKFKTLIYAVLYDVKPAAHDPSVVDTVRDTHVGDTAVPPPEVAESDLPIPDSHDVSDSAGAETQCANPWRTRPASALLDNHQSISKQATNHAVSSPEPNSNKQVEGPIENTSLRQEAAISMADALERGYRSAAEKRICEGWRRAFPRDEAAEALDKMTDELYQSAVDAEVRWPGAGVSMVVRAIKKKLARTT